MRFLYGVLIGGYLLIFGISSFGADFLLDRPVVVDGQEGLVSFVPQRFSDELVSTRNILFRVDSEELVQRMSYFKGFYEAGQWAHVIYFIVK